ncbi:MAG TPA: response regulator [Blastocatellia bacterium]|jgi:DNA-binding response OmpR family regulator|nr:response regulator [Blastocatellia bacterium]
MKKTVLVVEDDFDTQHPLAEILQLKGYLVATASDVERAFFTARAKRPDLIITDLMLPGKSGLDLIVRVRRDPAIKSIPIVVLSGCAPQMLHDAQRAGADYCLEKPIHFERFWETLERLIGEQRENARVETDIIAGDPDGGIASQIDQLVELLRHSPTEEEKEQILRLLKQQLLGRSHHSRHA